MNILWWKKINELETELQRTKRDLQEANVSISDLDKQF